MNVNGMMVKKMKYKTDRIAILMATYNGEKYIREQIESLLMQSFLEWDLFIHDDGSTDNTVGIIREYANKYSHKIHIIDGSATGGAKNNFFYLMRSVEAPYIMFCDQDDVWFKDKIEKTYKQMIEMEGKKGKNTPILVFTDLQVADQNLSIIANRMSVSQQLNPDKIQFKDILLQNVITGCTVMINQFCRDKSLSTFNIDNIIMHDWWCSLVAAYFGTISFVNEPLLSYRQHESNSVGSIQITDFHYIIKKIMKKDTIIEALELTRKQAKEFAIVYQQDANSLVARYSRLGENGKIKRMLFYIKNNMWKSGLIRNLGLIAWG